MKVAQAGIYPTMSVTGVLNSSNKKSGIDVALDAIVAAGASFLEHVSGGLKACGNLSITTLRYAFYGARIPFIYLEYFVHDAVHDTALAVIGNILYLFAEIGNFAQWLNHLNLIDLSAISSALGKVGVFGALGVCPIDAGLGIVSGIASVFYAVDYIMKLASGKLSDKEEVAVCFGLSASVVHIIALIIFFSSGGTLFPLTIGLTLASVALYITYWALREMPDENLPAGVVQNPILPPLVNVDT
jgi:hypothetical protein